MNFDRLASLANADQERLIRIVVPKIDHTSSALRYHFEQSLKKSKFSTRHFVEESLKGDLTSLMVSAHIAGIRRANLLAKAGKQSLELGLADTAAAFIQRLASGFRSLQKRYDTTALAVLNDASDDINKDLHFTVSALVKQGAHIREAKEVLKERFDRLGLKPLHKGQFETIFRTQAQIAFAAGKYQAETENPFIYRELWGYKYVTVEDSRVRPTHAILDGVCLPKDHPFWQLFYPPNGFNCRCQAIPIFVEMPIVMPPREYNGNPIAPDKGFALRPGTIFNPLAS